MVSILKRGFGLVLAVLLLAGCTQESAETTARPDPVHFESGDECHVCGMAITRFPGPKGEAFPEKGEKVQKFCSTRDLFAWLLQPENKNRDHTLYVHDMARADWHESDDRHLIDAREAWYVVGSEKTGAMGPTLASFASQDDAAAFAGEFGGNVLAFKEVTMAHLNQGMSMGGMAGMENMESVDGGTDADSVQH